MALPKRKTSKGRRSRRRANQKLKAPHTIPCRHCKKEKLSHRICSECGK